MSEVIQRTRHRAMFCMSQGNEQYAEMPAHQWTQMLAFLFIITSQNLPAESQTEVRPFHCTRSIFSGTKSVDKIQIVRVKLGRCSFHLCSRQSKIFPKQTKGTEASQMMASTGCYWLRLPSDGFQCMQLMHRHLVGSGKDLVVSDSLPWWSELDTTCNTGMLDKWFKMTRINEVVASADIACIEHWIWLLIKLGGKFTSHLQVYHSSPEQQCIADITTPCLWPRRLFLHHGIRVTKILMSGISVVLQTRSSRIISG
jgi:hypothetical protein